MKRAILKETATDREIEVHATTEHPDSSYGHPVWVDDEGTSYFQADLPIPNPFYTVIKTWED